MTPYRRRFALGELSLELFPSGCMLGAASLWVDWRQQRVVYAGQIAPWPSPLCERMEARRCDLLVLPCFLGGDRDPVLPPHEQSEQQIVDFAEQAREQGKQPVLLCPPLGVAQQLALLGEQRLKLRVRAHRLIYRATLAYARHTALQLSTLRRFEAVAALQPDELLLWPLALAGSPTLRRERSRLRLASVSALSALAPERELCDEAILWGDHADRPALLDYVQASRPQRVVLVGRHGKELLAAVRERVDEVELLSPTRQLPLL